jgi:hypothetical protein
LAAGAAAFAAGATGLTVAGAIGFGATATGAGAAVAAACLADEIALVGATTGFVLTETGVDFLDATLAAVLETVFAFATGWALAAGFAAAFATGFAAGFFAVVFVVTILCLTLVFQWFANFDDKLPVGRRNDAQKNRAIEPGRRQNPHFRLLGDTLSHF